MNTQNCKQVPNVGRIKQVKSDTNTIRMRLKSDRWCCSCAIINICLLYTRTENKALFFSILRIRLVRFFIMN